MGWEIPWYTLTDSFDADFGVEEWHGTNAFLRDGEKIFRTYFIDARGDEAMGSTWAYLDITALGRRGRSGRTRRRATRRPRRMSGGTCTTRTTRPRERLGACDTLGMTVAIARPKLEGNIAVGDDRQIRFAKFGAPQGCAIFWLHGTPGARRQIPVEARVYAEENDIRLIGVEDRARGIGLRRHRSAIVRRPCITCRGKVTSPGSVAPRTSCAA